MLEMSFPKRLPPSSRTVGDGHRRTVLIIDDDEHFRDLARGLFPTSEFRTLEASNLRQAMFQLETDDIDLVILDMVMPDRDGLEGIREIRSRFPESKVVAVSGSYRSDLYLHLAGLLGAEACLVKSQVEQFAQTIEGVLEQSVSRDGQAHLVSKYLKSKSAQIEAAEERLEAGDFEAVQRFGHRLLGTAGGYGFPVIQEIGARLESAATWSDHRNCALELSSLRTYVKSLVSGFP
jgi:CheY-like chemotaxis protein